MSIEQMRAVLVEKYGKNSRFVRASEAQVYSAYMRLLNAKKL